MVCKLDHPRIIKMVDAFANTAKGVLYLVMKLVPGATLRKYIKRIQKTRLATENAQQKDHGYMKVSSIYSIDSNLSNPLLNVRGGLSE